MKSFLTSVCVLLAVVGLTTKPTTAAASVVTIQLTATVGFVDDPFGLLGGKVHVGDTVTGVYAYDSSAVDPSPSSNIGNYYFADSAYGARLSVGDSVFRTNPVNVDFLLELVNDYNARDNYLFRSFNNLFDVSAGGPNPYNMVSWQLDDSTQTALSSVALPATPPISPAGNRPTWTS